MTFPDIIFATLQKISRKVLTGEYTVWRLDTGYYNKDNIRIEKCAYVIELPQKHELHIDLMQRDMFFDPPQLVGKFHWLRRWKNEYEHPKKIFYDLTLYRNNVMIAYTDRAQEAKYYDDLELLYRRCKMRLQIEAEKDEKESKARRDSENAKEVAKIKKVFMAI